MDIWAVRALKLETDVDELTAVAELRARVERLSDDAITELADCGQWITTLDDGEELAEVLTTSESSTYRAAATAQVKEAIMVAAVEVFFGGGRDRCRFVDSAGQPWIATGRMSPGDAPTDACHPIGMLHDIGISAEPVSLPTPDAKLCCPKCSGSSELASVEAIGGYCPIMVDTAEDDWTFGGHTEVNWDSSTTKGWVCRGCGWETANPRWIERFSIPAS